MDPHNAFMRFVDSQQIPPKGSNWGYINDPGVRCARQGGAQHVRSEGTRQGAGQDQHPMVDDAVFVWVVHDVWPNAISSKVKGYVHPKSWYVDFSPVTVSS